jgi:hypothetical protein
VPGIIAARSKCSTAQGEMANGRNGGSLRPTRFERFGSARCGIPPFLVRISHRHSDRIVPSLSPKNCFAFRRHLDSPYPGNLTGYWPDIPPGELSKAFCSHFLLELAASPPAGTSRILLGFVVRVLHMPGSFRHRLQRGVSDSRFLQG